MNETRSFLSTAIASGLDFEVMSPEDVIRHITMDVLAHHLPVDLKTRLVTAALEADTMNAMLVLDTLGVDALAEHVPPHLLWDCVSSAAGRVLGAPDASTPAIKATTKPAATVAPATQPGEPLPAAPTSPAISPAVNSAPRAAARKPNRAAVASRVGAGATSRSAQAAPLQAQAPVVEEEDSAFDVDTRVGHDPSLDELDVIEETAFGDPADEVTSHGHKP